jgi:hypothetical protein
MNWILLLVCLATLALGLPEELSEPGCMAPALLQAERGEVGVHKPKSVHEENSSNSSNVSRHSNGSKYAKLVDEEKSSNSSNVSRHSNGSKHAETKAEKHQGSQKTQNHTEHVHQRKPESSFSMPSYSELDANADGVVTPTEFQTESVKVIKKIQKHVDNVLERMKKLEEEKLSLEKQIDEMPAYEDLDNNTDGVVTPAEYKGSKRSALAQTLSYKSLDQNRDGTVTPVEFKEASEKWAANMTKRVQLKTQQVNEAREERRQLEKQIDMLHSYKDLDHKRDGVVTPEEYAEEMNIAHGDWDVKPGAKAIKTEPHKANAMVAGLGLAGIVTLVWML